MHIVIVGCGNVGKTITDHLSNEGHNIVVIDIKPEKVSATCEAYDVMGIVGNGASYRTLVDAGIEKADLLIAVSNSDELNLLCCVIAKKAGHCQTIARIGNPVYYREMEFIRKEMGISLIVNPKLATAREVLRLIKYPSALKTYAFAKERVEIVKIPVKGECILNNCALKDLSTKTKSEALVCIVERGDEVLIPDGEFVLREKDIVSVVVPEAQLNDFFKKISYANTRIKKVLMVGGVKTAEYIGTFLDEMGVELTLIERNRDRCEELCERLPKSVVVCGDGTDRDILTEEEIEKLDAFIAWTELDEENIMLALYAKQESKAKVIAQVHRTNYDEIIKSLDIGSVLCPKNITAEHIIRYVRAMSNTIGSNVETLYHLIEGKVEALEFIVREEVEGLVNIPLSELRLKDNILVCCIQRKNKTITPKGNDVIKKGDAVVVITTTSGLTHIRDIVK